jgi:hypothetical protein
MLKSIYFRFFYLTLLCSNFIFSQEDSLKGKVKLITVYDYDEVGNLLNKTKNYFYPGNRIKLQLFFQTKTDIINSKKCFYYRKDNSLLKSELYFYGKDTNDILSYVIYKFDTKGNIIKTIEPGRKINYAIESNDVFSIDISDELKKEVKFVYDNYGNWISKETFINQKKSKFTKRTFEYFD